MLSWALTFLVIAIIAAVLGFGGIAGAAAGIAELLFYVFVVLFLIAIVYDQLAHRGIKIGKFLLVGPLLGGLYLGLTPLSDFQTMNVLDPSQSWLFNAFLGVVIGDGVGAGFEITELLLGPVTPAEPAPVAERPDRWAL